MAQKILEAQKALPNGYKLVLRCGFRSLSIQKQHYKETLNKIAKNHPNWSKQKIKIETGKKLAPTDIIVPPHSTGGAVDVTIMGPSGKMLDMGASFNDMTAATFTNYASVSSEVKKNRDLLVFVMEKVGMINYPTEWWHWSYGDQYWAAKEGKDFAIYDSIKLKKE